MGSDGMWDYSGMGGSDVHLVNMVVSCCRGPLASLSIRMIGSTKAGL